MVKKILFWINAYPLHFPLSYHLSKQDDFELYSIIDVPDNQKKFYKEQNLVNFKRSEFYHDHIKSNLNPDEDYLSKFENKYKINLWTLAYNERILYNFNEYHNFNTKEVLSILESECKFFEKMLDEINPEYVIMYDTTLHHDHLFYEICKAKKIKTLFTLRTRFGDKVTISSTPDIMDCINKKQEIIKNRTWEELQGFLEDNCYSNIVKNFEENFTKSKIHMINAVIKYIFSNNSNPNTHYGYYGRTKIRVLIKSINNLINKRKRSKFINKKFSNKIPSEKFILYTMHQEPERSLLISAPFYTNEIEIIKNIVKSMPIGYKLAVKEHPAMNSRGWRKISVYNKIKNLPNVIMIHPALDTRELILKSSLVISITGTISMEAAFYKKPSIVFDETSFSHLPSITKIQNLKNLPNIIKQSFNSSNSIDELNKFVNQVEENSFYFNFNELDLDFQKHFTFGGFLADVDLPIDKMEEFLIRNEKNLQVLVSEHIKKMKNYP